MWSTFHLSSADIYLPAPQDTKMQFKIVIAALLAPLAVQAQSNGQWTCCCRSIAGRCPGITASGPGTDCGSLCSSTGLSGACYVGACN